MTDSMIKRVTDAIFAAQEKYDVDTMTVSEQEFMATAAIEAMRNPTKAMIYAGNSKIDECIDFWNYDSGAGYAVGSTAAFDALNAMIDEALK